MLCPKGSIWTYVYIYIIQKILEWDANHSNDPIN